MDGFYKKIVRIVEKMIFFLKERK